MNKCPYCGKAILATDAAMTVHLYKHHKDIWSKCPRCSGRGFIPRFGHIFKGMCFQCKGTGKVS